jgi:hypothetical protein
MIKLKAKIKKPTSTMGQLFNYWWPLLLTYKPPRIYGWLWWNFSVVEPPLIETHSYCEADSEEPWHIRILTSAGKKLNGGADTHSLCGREISWDRAPVVTKHPPIKVCIACQEAWENESRV